MLSGINVDAPFNKLGRKVAAVFGYPGDLACACVIVGVLQNIPGA